jgi:CRISPR-associated protein Cas2
MMVLITYDVSTETAAGRKRLARVAKTCKNYGQRVQFSVFECIVDPAQWALIESKLVNIIDPEKDSLRFYFLGSNYKPKIVHIGAKPTLDQEGPLVI